MSSLENNEAEKNRKTTRRWGVYRDSTSNRVITIGGWPGEPEKHFVHDNRTNRFARLNFTDDYQAEGANLHINFNDDEDIQDIEGKSTDGEFQAQRLPIRIESFDFVVGKERLAGRLWLPEKQEKCPAVVIVGGTGGNLRDDYRIYPGLFVQLGYAVYAYDKRGFGDSSGERGQSEEGIHPLANDLIAAVQVLREREDIDSSRVGALGISHGAWVAIEAARLDPAIAFVIPVVGGGVPLWRALLYETERTLQTRGYDPTTVEEAKSSMLTVFELLRNGDANLLPSLLQQLNNFAWFEDTALARFKGLSPEVIELAAKHIWDGELSYDPLPALQNIAVPILAILAEKDDFVPATECIKSFAELKREGVEVLLLQGADHWQSIEGDDQGFTYSPQLIPHLKEWLAKQNR